MVLAEAFLEGRIVGYEAPRMATHAAALGDDDAATAAATDKKVWIGIELVDDDDPPRPVRHARYRIVLPDGSEHEGNLNEHGIAILRGIDPGNCKITFPDFDGKTWRPA